MRKCLLVLLSIGLLSMILNGCRSISPSDSSQEKISTEDIDDSLPYYGTWEVKDYQSAEVSTLSLDDMESFRGMQITYQADSIIVDDEKVTDQDLIYEIDDVAYNCDSFSKTYKANLGEWWNNIDEVTHILVESNDTFFGEQFFVVDPDTIWVYYEGVFFLAKIL